MLKLSNQSDKMFMMMLDVGYTSIHARCDAFRDIVRLRGLNDSLNSFGVEINHDQVKIGS